MGSFLEFIASPSVAAVDKALEMIGGGPFHLLPG